MKAKNSVLSMIICLVLAAPALAGGFGAGVRTYDGDLGVQLRKEYNIGGDIGSFTGQAGLIFADSEVFTVDADYHFNLTRQQTRFYGLVGPQLAFNSDFTEFGVNLGAGLNFMMTDTRAAFAEVKVVVVSDYDGVVATVGLFF